MRAQRRNAITDAVEPLQYALKVIVRHVLWRKAKMFGNLGP
jgi:hypothetical protein